MKEIALQAATLGGEVVKSFFENSALRRELKDDKSFVTEADKKTEEVIVATLRNAFPEHGFLGEEGGGENEHAEHVWVIDPIDGTGNFINGIPLFGISIALLERGQPVLGVIFNPITNSLYVAEKGKGVLYNGKPVTVSKQPASEGAITFGYGRKGKERAFALAAKAPNFFKTVRILGSAVLDLAYVARGGTEAAVGGELNTWDYAAGALLVTEAGGVITKHDGSPWSFGEGSFVVSNGVAHQGALTLVETV